MGAVQPLDVILVKDGGHWLDPLQGRLHFGQHVFVEHCGMHGGLVHVVFEDVPTGKDHVVQVCDGNEVLNQRALICRALARRMVPI